MCFPAGVTECEVIRMKVSGWNAPGQASTQSPSGVERDQGPEPAFCDQSLSFSNNQTLGCGVRVALQQDSLRAASPVLSLAPCLGEEGAEAWCLVRALFGSCLRSAECRHSFPKVLGHEKGANACPGRGLRLVPSMAWPGGV